MEFKPSQLTKINDSRDKDQDVNLALVLNDLSAIVSEKEVKQNDSREMVDNNEDNRSEDD